jgi:hypothetical protein
MEQTFVFGIERCLVYIHLYVLSSFMIYHWVCNESSTVGTTSGAQTTFPSGAPEFTSDF